MTNKEQNNVHVVHLAEYQKPEVTESKRDNWVCYGIDNGYYDFLIDRYHKSPTNNAVINNMGRLIYGRGLHALDASKKPSQYAQFRSIVGAEDLRNLSLELKMLGQGHLQVHYDKSHTKILKVYHIPTALIRPEKCNDEGEIENYYYCDNWQDTRKFEPQAYPAFGTSKKDIEILCIRSYSVGLKYFSSVDYQGCVPYTVLEEEVGDYLINEVQNGFSGTRLINFNNGVPSEEIQDQTETRINQKFSGARGAKQIIAFNANKESAAEIIDIPLNDAPEHYSYLSTECVNKILVGHNITSPMLVGVVTENQGFSSNADEIEIAAKYFYNTAVRPFQDLIIDGIEKILAFNGISLDLYFRRLNLLEDIEADAQAKEETQLKFNSHLEGLLEGFGEDINLEEWELLDEREVDYDQEDSLDEQVKEWENSLKKPSTVLSKVLNFVSSGTANPNASSSQDKEIDGFHFKVRYEYTGNPTPDRDFCKVMMSRNKLYRKEDILRMGSSIVNAGFGEFGADTYDIFKYKGGPRCNHKWKRKTFVSASKSIDTKSPNATTVSTGKAQKFGYRVDNPSEVSMKPNDMKYKGFSPNNPNRPQDAR